MSKKLGLLILGLIFCLSIACAVNPITGEEQFMLVSKNQDVDIGRQYAPEVEKQLGCRIENESLQNYINSVGQKVARVSHRTSWPYHFVALNDSSTNALALPGGYIFITKGMLEKLTTEAQLAGILGHEIVHVVARHASAAMSREIGLEVLMSAALSQSSSKGALMAAQLARRIVGLQYSRNDEREADLAALDYLVAAGYNPHGMVETMQILQDTNEERPIEFLSTHPPPQNRKAYSMYRIQTRYSNIARLRIGKEEYYENVLQQLKN